MSTTITTPKQEIGRDRWGRPLVTPLGGGKPVAYTRATTYVGAIDDTYKLGQWQQRHVAVGLAAHPDLLDSVRKSDLDDKSGLNDLCDEAKRRAGAGDSALIGTYLHAVTEAIDRGEDGGSIPMPSELAFPRDPSDFLADVAAYMVATEEMTAVHIEQFCVNDPQRIGGTPDRIAKFRGDLVISDLKTGSLDWGFVKIAAQLAVYARSACYDIATGKRTPHGADLEKGLVVHMPAGTGECTLYWVDLLAGWDAVRTCKSVREQRARKYRDIITPVATELPSLVELTMHEVIELKITGCTTAEEVRALWGAHAADWTDELTAVARAHIASL